MPRESDNSKFLEMLFDAIPDQGGANFEILGAEYDDISWQSAFLEIGVSPLALGKLKLTRQQGRIFDQEDMPSPAFDFQSSIFVSISLKP